MNKQELEAFWRENDPATVKHADNLLKTLSERKKDISAFTSKNAKLSTVAVLLFWAVATQQGTVFSFLGVTFSKPEMLLTILMCAISYMFYVGTVAMLHQVTIEKAISAYFATWLPKSEKLHLNQLASSISSEINLGQAGILNKWSSMTLGLVHPLLVSLVSLFFNLMTIGWVACAVSFPRFNFFRIVAVLLSFGFSLRAIWMLGEYVAREFKREPGGRIILHLFFTVKGLRSITFFLTFFARLLITGKWKKVRAVMAEQKNNAKPPEQTIQPT